MAKTETAGWRRGLLRLLSLAARPVRVARWKGGVVLQPYRGYGSASEIFLIGRVFLQKHPGEGGGGVADDLRNISRRIARKALRGARVRARFYGAEQTVETDPDGYFRFHLTLPQPPPSDACWHEVALDLEGDQPVRAKGEVFIPPADSRLVVISDIDDTVVKTGVANVFKMLWRLFVADAESRVAFPGVAALYRGLHHGASGRERNPMLYVSRAPWGTYEVLAEIFQRHGIPVGPILFLREWGLSWRRPWPRAAKDHKKLLITNMLALYSDLPFVLIGDSGQHDPEIYGGIVQEHPGRVLAVYIRDVTRSRERLAEIETLAAAVAKAGSALLLAADSAAIAEHARKLGCLSDDAVRAVRDEAESGGGKRRAPVDVLTRPTPGATAKAVGAGELQTLIGDTKNKPDGNVLVEPGPAAAKGSDAHA
ncbi:phosphatase [Alsobacter metallidurans]|uniref:Phosphatase n=1 Tax=Alsobacter metallidurans TaxID=340221 RepID=A0A917MIR5_9HYPH|nr:phosphatase domain-containing protein [Alsobacter metallidurans]GGH12838.1 phosphatase [Alsobacter metallidurans]